MSSKKFKSWEAVERFIKHNKNIIALNVKEMSSNSIIVIYAKKQEKEVNLFARI